MRLRTILRIPREHGAWGMLYVPLLTGALVAGSGAWRVALLALSATFVFVGRESVLALWRARAWGRDSGNAGWLMAVYFALAALCAAPLAAVWRLAGVVPLGVAAAGLLAWNAVQAARREDRTIATEVTGIAGLTLTAPAAHYVASMEWSATAFWLWLWNALYFISSVFYVKLRVLSAHGKDPAPVERIRSQCAFYHWALSVALAMTPVAPASRPLLAAAFAAPILRALYHLVRPARTLILRRVGRLEIVYSVLFLALLVAAFRAGGA